MKSFLYQTPAGIAVVLLIVAFALSSCVPTLKVSREYGETVEKVDGIPFYTQKGIIRQQTQYLTTWKTILLVKIEKRADDQEETILLEGNVLSGKEVQFLKNELNKAVLDGEDALLERFENAMDSVRLSSDDMKSHAELISNSWSPAMIIDYETKYYLNAKMPWLGTSSLAQKLDAQGIITEASVDTDSQIDELITSAASAVSGIVDPIANIKIAKIQSEQPPTASDAKLFGFQSDLLMAKWQPEISYELRVEEKGYLYTFTSTVCTGSCSAYSFRAIGFDLLNGNYTRTEWPKESSKVEKEEKPTIGITGSITLPDKKDAK